MVGGTEIVVEGKPLAHQGRPVSTSIWRTMGQSVWDHREQD